MLPEFAFRSFYAVVFFCLVFSIWICCAMFCIYCYVLSLLLFYSISIVVLFYVLLFCSICIMVLLYLYCYFILFCLLLLFSSIYNLHC